MSSEKKRYFILNDILYFTRRMLKLAKGKYMNEGNKQQTNEQMHGFIY